MPRSVSSEALHFLRHARLVLEVPASVLCEVVSGEMEAVVYKAVAGEEGKIQESAISKLEGVGYEERDQAPKAGVRELPPE